MGANEKNGLRLKYWVVVNGDLVMACPMPYPEFPAVSPTPEMLIGFDSRKEQMDCQCRLLRGTAETVRGIKTIELPMREREGEVVLKKFPNPQRATRGYVTWNYQEVAA